MYAAGGRGGGLDSRLLLPLLKVGEDGRGGVTGCLDNVGHGGVRTCCRGDTGRGGVTGLCRAFTSLSGKTGRPGEIGRGGVTGRGGETGEA